MDQPVSINSDRELQTLIQLIAANYDEDLGMLFLNDWSHQVRLESGVQLSRTNYMIDCR